jgi:hypothetical protein
VALRLALGTCALGLISPGSAQTAVPAPSNIQPRRIVIDDGQLKSHPFQVFVTHPITDAMNPTLRLTGMHAVTAITDLEKSDLKPKHVLARQNRAIVVDGIPASAEGTLLIFDLSPLHLPLFKSAARFLPLVSWTETAPGKEAARESIAAPDEIYLGNMPGAAVWTIAIVGSIVLVLLFWSAAKAREITKFPARPTLLLITGPDGFLSLWRAQLLFWTIAVGSLVTMFGLLQLRVPEIPEPLVVLMGMSLLTGTVSALKAGQSSATATRPPAPAAPPAAPAVPAPAAVAPVAAPAAAAIPPPAPIIRFNSQRAGWADLISVWNKGTGQVELSLPKAQMVFWTITILVLFVVKSILLGALWAVPWELVALTGFSQAGYIGDKFVSQQNAT